MAFCIFFTWRALIERRMDRGRGIRRLVKDRLHLPLRKVAGT